MAENMKRSCWDSTLEIQHEDDKAKSVRSVSEWSEEDDNPNACVVGTFMCNLFAKQLYTDVDFFSKLRKESISAHRVVLAAKCDFFERLLFGDQKNDATGMKMQVEINNVPFGVFKNVIRYIYTGDIDFTDDSTVLDINSTAQSFEIQPLIDKCEHYMKAIELTEDNVCSILQMSNVKNAEYLKSRCTNYIKANMDKVISSPDFEKCSYSTVRKICDLQGVNLQSETEILEAIMRWINLQPEHTKKDLKTSLLKRIRFLSFTAKEFRDIARKYPNLLTQGESLDLLMYLNDPSSKNIKELPEWINKSRRSFSRGFQMDHQSAQGRIKIPLKPACEQQQMTELTCVLQMKCIKGDHQINAINFLFQDISHQGNKIAVLIINTLVTPKRHQLCFSKTVDSKETVLKFDRGIFIRKGQTFHLKVELKACQSCKFQQFDDLNKFENEHFQCSVASKPKRGKFFFIDEVEYVPRVHFRHPSRSRNQ